MFKKNQLRSLSTLFLIGMTFILPIFLASVLYFFGHDWLVQKTNRGSLLNPPLALNQFHFVEENGS
ncbi:MAG: hypothetical protein JSS53_03425, partial [Proteobacteria bacterium]|nr:hypothetical protein [Pseudomonadota bacterium]